MTLTGRDEIQASKLISIEDELNSRSSHTVANRSSEDCFKCLRIFEELVSVFYTNHEKQRYHFEYFILFRFIILFLSIDISISEV